MQISQTTKTLGIGFLVLLGVIILRTIAEAISDIDPSLTPKTLASGTDIFLHFLPWYLVLFILIALILNIFSGVSVVKAWQFVTCFSPVLLLPPIIDLISSQGAGLNMSYCEIAAWGDIPRGFLTTCNVTIGLKSEIVGISIGVLAYILIFSRNFWKAIVGSVITYFVIGLAGMAPFFVIQLRNVFLRSSGPLTLFSYSRVESLSKEIGIIFFILLLILLLILFLKINKRKTIIILKNSRPLRVIPYLLMTAIGLAVAIFTFDFTNWNSLAILSTIILFISIILAWMQSALFNDMIDQKIDVISEPKRALASQKLNPTDYYIPIIIILVLSLWAAAFISLTIFLVILSIIVVTYFYSAPPYRLKKWPLLSNLSLGLVALLCTAGGFVLFSPEQSWQKFPIELVWLVLALFTLASVVKDLKDMTADFDNKVYTIPNLIQKWGGKDLAYQIVGAIIAAAILLVPIILRTYINEFLIVFSILFAGIAWWLTAIRNTNTKNILLVLYFYIIGAGLIMLISSISTF